MATTFGTLAFATSFKPSTAFPLNANEYFESYEEALAAAQSAEEAGSSNTVYFYGQILIVYEDSAVKLYQIQPTNTLKEFSTSDSVSTDIGNLQDLIDQIEANITSIESNIDEIEADLSSETSAREAKDTELETSISNLQSNIEDGTVTAGIADKLGTEDVGSGTTPIYLDDGVATASTSTVGSSVKPIYLNSGVFTEVDFDYTSIDSRISSIETSLESGDIATKISELEAKDSSLESDISDLNSDLESYKTTVSETYATQTSLSEEISNRQSADNALDERVTILEDTTIPDLDTRVSDLETASTTASNDISSLSAKLDEEITNRESADQTLQGNIDSLSSTLTSFQTTVSETYATKTELSDAIDQEVSDRDSAISTLQSNIEDGTVVAGKAEEATSHAVTLINSDTVIDEYYGSDYYGKDYYFIGGQTPTTVPSTNGGYLQVRRSGSAYTIQILYTNLTGSSGYLPVVYTRTIANTNGYCSPWEEQAEANGTYANMTVGTANKLGTSTVGSVSNPIYLNAGVATEVTTSTMSVGSAEKDSDGNVIVDTYATKTDIDDLEASLSEKIDEVSTEITAGTVTQANKVSNPLTIVYPTGESSTSTLTFDGSEAVTFTSPVYSLQAASLSEEESETIASKYYLAINGNTIGDPINIPKDMFLDDATLEVVEEADSPYTGAVVGDKYIDLTLNNGNHLYLPVDDLVDVYTGDGSTITISEDNIVSVNEVPWDQIRITEDLMITQSFGKYSPDSSGSYTIECSGKTLSDFFKEALQDETNPSTTQPTVSITLSNAGSKEVGTVFTPSYTVSFNAGSYTYGPATGVTVESYAVSDTNGNTSTTASGSFDSFTVGDSTSYRCSVTVTHTAGATPVTNLGNDYEAGAISAGTKSANSSYVTGYRCMFYGTLTSKPDSMTSSDIRGLSSRSAAATTLTVSIPTGAYRVVIAVPSSYVVNSVLDVNGLNAQIFSSFTETTIEVEGANGYTATTYNVYYIDYSSANDTANTYTVTVASA